MPKMSFTDASLAIPYGSYQNSCSECHLSTSEEKLSLRLVCKCRTKEPSDFDFSQSLMNFTSFDPKDCKYGDIANNDGMLECQNSFFEDLKLAIKFLGWHSLFYVAAMGIMIRVIGGKAYLDFYLFGGLPSAILQQYLDERWYQVLDFFREKPIIVSLIFLFITVQWTIVLMLGGLFGAVVLVGIPLVIWQTYHFLKEIVVLVALALSSRGSMPTPLPPAA